MIKLCGKEVSSSIYEDIKSHNVESKTIAIITVGEDEASKVYVNTKKKKAVECGFNYIHIQMDENTSFKSLSSMVDNMNKNPEVKGIIIQKPYPPQLRLMEQYIDTLVAPEKDIDGFHPMSDFDSCTPRGIITLLDYYKVPYAGKNVVIAGRSNIVAKPLAEMLMKANCTVTMIHSYTDEDTVAKLIANCDVFVSAIGRPKYWTKHYFMNKNKRLALVDVGINRDENNKLCGDIHPDCYEYFEYYTPVPGGVGLMTVATLIDNLNKS